MPPLTGSWRSFSPNLTPAVAEKFREIEEGTMEALRDAGASSAHLKEAPPEPPPLPRP
jgi:hypothetical protein